MLPFSIIGPNISQSLDHKLFRFSEKECVFHFVPKALYQLWDSGKASHISYVLCRADFGLRETLKTGGALETFSV
jgi:hypothetical protein